MLNKRPDTDIIVLDDIDPSLEWVEESHPNEFEVDFDVNLRLILISSIELGGVDPNADLVVEPTARGNEKPGPSMAHGIGEGSSSRATQPTRASSSPRPSIAIEAGEEYEEPSDSDPNDIYVAPADDPISSSGDEFDE